MKKTLFLLLVFCFTLSGFGQVKSSEIQKLAITAKIWGFLKYYHPEVGKGKFNWDDQLFEILPKVLETKNKQELSITFLKWIDSLGEIEICENCTTKEDKNYFGKNFDLAWIHDSTLFSKELIQKLTFVETNRFQGKHRYVSTENAGNIKVLVEPEKSSFSWENRPLRLLTLFRYWNMVEYFFPYKYQMDKDWDVVLNESIPNFLALKTETEYHLALLELIVNINDSHGYFSSTVLNTYFGENWISAKFQLIDNKAIITGSYNEELSLENDLKIGDVLLKVDGKEIATILRENNKYINGSNTSVKLRNALGLIFNGSDKFVAITFERKGVISDKVIKRYPFYKLQQENSVHDKWKILENNIGYVNLGQLEREDVSKVMDTLSSTKAIIFDIRNYPKGTMYAISDYLNKTPKEFVKFTKPDLSYIGKFYWTDAISTGSENPHAYEGKVILLVNETTQSHAEFTAMCLQTAENSIIIGSQTAGADGNVSVVHLIGEHFTMFSGIGVYYPNGKETQRIGIIPDIEIRPSIEGIKHGIDEVLEKAIQVASE